MQFIDFSKRVKSMDIDLLFPDWRGGEETVAFLSPHDDDVLLGASYLLQAVLQNEGNPLLFIFCSGDAGYSTTGGKDTIVKRRKAETRAAYGLFGLKIDQIVFFDIPDFSLMPQVNRKDFLEEGLFEDQVRFFRMNKVTRVVFSSGYFEHWDHTAVYLMGRYIASQAGDPILADLGVPQSVSTHLTYSVWCDFEPRIEDPRGIRVSKGILADSATEKITQAAIRKFSSQSRIFKDIVDAREQRRSGEGYLELYQNVEVRPKIDYKKYLAILKDIDPKE